MVFVERLNALASPPSVVRVAGTTREAFARSYIAPITLKAREYICLYRKIVENGCHVYAEPSKEILPAT